MNNTEPNSLVFKTRKGNQYIYDACTNRVFPTLDPIPGMLNLYNKKSKDEICSVFENNFSKEICSESYNQIDKWVKKDNAFFNYNLCSPEYSYNVDDYLEDISTCHHFSLVLNVTENCNLRCKYCSFSGQYPLSRKHSLKYMSFNIAKRSIDYYMNFIKSEKMVSLPVISIGFYGGEPLLNFSLIKKCIEYVNNVYNDDKIIYTITTNGTLLNSKVIDFLAENEVSLLVSLDGPKEEHDRNRVLKNGKGSYTVIINNIRRLKKIYPDYYNMQVTNISCHDWGSNLYKICDYFDEDVDNLLNLTRISMVNDIDTTYYSRFSKSDHENYLNFVKNLRKMYFQKCINIEEDKKSKFLTLFFSGDSRKCIRRHLNIKLNRFTGICIPGVKIFVSNDGNFHICEKMDYSFPIGDYISGINFHRVEKVMEDFHNQVIIKNNCNICIGRNLCRVCYVNSSKNGYFSTDESCKNIEQRLKKSFSLYYSILEENQEFMKKTGQYYTILDP